MPIKYVPFIPEPVEGQAVLGNFNRILKYKGADDVSMVLQRGMPLYELEKQETVGENKDGNMVIRGECVSACAYLKEQGIQVDLVYIDPPLDVYKRQVQALPALGYRSALRSLRSCFAFSRSSRWRSRMVP